MGWGGIKQEGKLEFQVWHYGNLSISSYGISLVLLLQDVICGCPQTMFSLWGVEVWFPHSFLLLSERRQFDPTSEDARRQWKFDVVHIGKYISVHGSLSTDTFQILHVIRRRDKVQILVLHEKHHSKASLPGVQGTGPQRCRLTCHPGGHCKLHTDVAACTPCACQNGWCFILFKESDLLTIPSLKEPRKGHSCGRPRTGHPSDFSTTLNFTLSPTIGEGLKCKEPPCVY